MSGGFVAHMKSDSAGGVTKSKKHGGGDTKTKGASPRSAASPHDTPPPPALSVIPDSPLQIQKEFKK